MGPALGLSIGKGFTVGSMRATVVELTSPHDFVLDVGGILHPIEFRKPTRIGNEVYV